MWYFGPPGIEYYITRTDRCLHWKGGDYWLLAAVLRRIAINRMTLLSGGNMT